MSATPLMATGSAAPVEPDILLDCLPPRLRAPTTDITRIAAGMSGAGVYRVAAEDQQFVLKLTSQDEAIEPWRIQVQIQQAAADAGIAPQVLHVDESRRAVLSELVVDRSFPSQLGNPATRDSAITALGSMLRQLHALPVPNEARPADAMEFLRTLRNEFPSDFVLPSFVRDAFDELSAETPAVCTTGLVLSHNDVNPSNLIFDGTRVLLLDWQTLAPNDPYYDLATAAMFFRFDDDACRKLIAAHQHVAADEPSKNQLPKAFLYCRRLAAVLSGAAGLRMARSRGHMGGNVSADTTPSLAEVYQQMRARTLDIRSVDGQWRFGLALVKAGIAGK